MKTTLKSISVTAAVLLASAMPGWPQPRPKPIRPPCPLAIPGHATVLNLKVTGEATDSSTVKLSWSGPKGTYTYQEVGGSLGGSKYLSDIPLTPECNPFTNPTLTGCQPLKIIQAVVIVEGISPPASPHIFVVKGPDLCGTATVVLPPGSPPPLSTLDEVMTDISRAGRMVAVSVSAADKQTALAASDSGGLFRTENGGDTWQHVDAFPPFRIVDVAFAEAGAADPNVVIATTIKDAQISPTTNTGGIWRSTDLGTSWSHIQLPASCPPPLNAHGIAFSGTNSVFVAADCGLLASTNLGSTWNNIFPTAVRSVVVQSSTSSTLIDVCQQGGGHRRSTDGGTTWSPLHSGPTCETAHALAVSPLENNILFATFAVSKGTGLRESDDGGQTWIDLQATSNNERPVWVRTNCPTDQHATHFDLYFPGRLVTCSNSAGGLRCPSNAGESWLRVPQLTLNHDLNGLAFEPGGDCPLLMVADYGVFRTGGTTPDACAIGWEHVGRASTGIGSRDVRGRRPRRQRRAARDAALLPASLALYCLEFDECRESFRPRRTAKDRQSVCRSERRDPYTPGRFRAPSCRLRSRGSARVRRRGRRDAEKPHARDRRSRPARRQRRSPSAHRARRSGSPD